MSFSLVTAQEKRLFRLKNYLAPYPYIRLRLAEEALEPVRIRVQFKADQTAAGDPKGGGKSRLELTVNPLLLCDSAPLTLESEILSHTLSVEKQYRDIEQSGDDTLESKHLNFLRDIFRQIKAKQVVVPPEVVPEAIGEDISLKSVWDALQQQYFPERGDLNDYRVLWSNRRQTSSLASCSINNRRILVARTMDHPDCQRFLEPLIYHEMCHAVLGEPKVVRGRRIMHGKDFRELERKHPGIKELNIWIKAGGWTKAVREIEG